MLLFNDFSPTFMFGVLVAVLIGMTVHEFSHNYAAHLMGDPTPSRTGKLTLDPMAHIYWPGFIMFVLIGFGILGTAPVNHRLMRNPRWGYLVAVASGPFSNLLVAIVGGIVWQVVGMQTLAQNRIFWDLLYTLVVFNILLFIFNLLPLFPLDGWSIVLTLLPAEQAYTWQKHAQTTQIVFIVMIMLSFLNIPGIDPFGLIVGEPLYFLRNLLLGL